jgi:hypothetical protein
VATLDGDRILAVDLDTSNLVVLEGSSCYLWQRIGEGMEVAELVRRVMEDHVVDADRARRDVSEFIGNLNGLGLLECDDCGM